MNKHDNSYLQRAFNKYGEENFTFEVIEFIKHTEDKLEFKKIILEREQYWIDKLNVCNCDFGYNLAPIAGSCLGRKCTEETKRKISIANTGNQKLIDSLTGHSVSDDTRKKIGDKNRENKNISKKLTGIKRSQETKDKISKLQKGRKKPKHVVDNLRKIARGKTPWNKGLKMSKGAKKKMSDSLKKTHEGKCLCVLNTSTGDFFKTAKDAALFYDIGEPYVRSICNGNKKASSIYNFIYCDNDKNIIENRVAKNKKRKVINVDTMDVFESISDAVKVYGHNRTYMTKVCSGKLIPLDGDYRWQYYEDYIKENNIDTDNLEDK